MEPFADVDDVQAAWLGAPLTDTQLSAAPILLAYASAVLRSRFKTIDARVTSGALDGDLPRLVAVQMVKRVLENPASTVESETAGPFTVRYRDVADLLTLTDAEIRLLVPASKRAGVRSIRATSWSA